MARNPTSSGGPPSSAGTTRLDNLDTADSILFGIVIPTFNEAHSVARLLASIQRQVGATYEVVVVDQGSTDETVTIARTFGTKVAVVARPPAYIPWITPPWPAHSRNLGAQLVRGKILVHLDADMELASDNFLTKLEQLIDPEHQAAVLHEEDRASGFWGECKALERSLYIGSSVEAARAVSRTLFSAVGGYDEATSSGEDFLVSARYERFTKLASDPGLILYHHLGALRLRTLLKKKFAYGRTVGLYLRQAKQAGGRSAFKVAADSMRAYVTNWRIAVRHPILYLAIGPMRVLEFGAVTVGALIAGWTPARGSGM